MLALSLTPAASGALWDKEQSLEASQLLSWRKWLEMLKPDTPAQYRTSDHGWRSRPEASDTSME